MPVTTRQALAFLQNRVFEPALASKALDKGSVDQIKNTWGRLQHFRRPGDVLTFMEPATGGKRASATFAKLKAAEVGIRPLPCQPFAWRVYPPAAAP